MLMGVVVGGGHEELYSGNYSYKFPHYIKKLTDKVGSFQNSPHGHISHDHQIDEG